MHSFPTNKESRCPVCRHITSGATNITNTDDKEVPREGDVTVCLHCASPSVFNSDLTLHQLTSEDWGRLSPMEQRELEVAQKAVASFIVRRKDG